jgi:hypothetical protein
VWSRERIPDHFWDQVNDSPDLADRHVDIIDVGPLWRRVGEHTRFPTAPFCYRKTPGLWTIYWRDRT